MVKQVDGGLVTSRSAELVGLMLRQCQRPRREWEHGGDSAVVHRLGSTIEPGQVASASRGGEERSA